MCSAGYPATQLLGMNSEEKQILFISLLFRTRAPSAPPARFPLPGCAAAYLHLPPAPTDLNPFVLAAPSCRGSPCPTAPGNGFAPTLRAFESPPAICDLPASCSRQRCGSSSARPTCTSGPRTGATAGPAPAAARCLKQTGSSASLPTPVEGVLG